MNPRPLGYEPYDVRLSRLGPSLDSAVTSADRTDPVSLGRLRLPRLVLSRRVRFTNRFTEQPIDLQFPASLRALPSLRPWARQRVRTRQATASGAASTRDASLPVVPRGSRWESLWEVPYGPEWEWLRREAQDFEETVAAGPSFPVYEVRREDRDGQPVDLMVTVMGRVVSLDTVRLTLRPPGRVRT